MFQDIMIKNLFIELQNNEQKTGIVFKSNGSVKMVKYGEFLADIFAIQKKMNFTHGEVFGIALRNSYLWIVWFFAVILSGNIAVLMESEGSYDRIKYIIKDAKVTYVISDADNFLYNKMTDNFIRTDCDEIVLNRIVTASEINKYRNYDIVIYTSGSDGKPKGVKLDSNGILYNAKCLCDYVKFERGLFLPLPLYHAYALTVGLFAMLYCQNWIYVSKSMFDIKELQESHAKAILAVPAVVDYLYKNIERRNKDKKDTVPLLGNLRQILCGGTSLKSSVELFFLESGVDLIKGYGMTECGTVVSAENENCKKIGSVGKILPCYKLKIEKERDCEYGEILIKSDLLMRGYLNDINENKGNIYFHTGDIGYIDSEGYLFILGRKKNIITLNNGKKVMPEELEQQIKKCKFVKEVEVILKREEKNEYLVAIIEVEEKGEEVQEFIRQHISQLNSKLPIYMRVEGIVFEQNGIKKNLIV